jgi:hypothetical protein
MKNVLEIITDNKVGYKFACDDRKTVKGGVASTVPTDDYFTLTEIDKLNELLVICNKFHLQYDLYLEEWSESDQEIVKEIYIVNTNYKNNI